jgi:holo-[acyl-carrier protein] synthase
MDHAGNTMQVVGIGTEIVECLRIAQLIERHGEQFIQGVFAPEEIQYCASRKHSTQHFAAYWAGKQAVRKSLATGWIRDVYWRDLVIKQESGAGMLVVLSGDLADLALRRGVTRVMLSLAHCRTHATAYAMALDTSDLVEPPEVF